MKPVTDINLLESLAKLLGDKQAIYFGHDGTNTRIITWGDTVELSAQAAAGANHVKKQWGWPATDVVESAKVKALRDRIAELEAQSALATFTVHVIEGTEHERGWGQRPDGYVAFLSKVDAENWIVDYHRIHNGLAHAPDEYTTYQYVGIKECSFEFLKSLSGKPFRHFSRLKDLK